VTGDKDVAERVQGSRCALTMRSGEVCHGYREVLSLRELGRF
jgi:hypothetical protein